MMNKLRFLKAKYLSASLLTIVLIAISSCVMEDSQEVKTQEESFERPGVAIDLPEIIKKGKLTILAENSTTSYFFYKV